VNIIFLLNIQAACIIHCAVKRVCAMNNSLEYLLVDEFRQTLDRIPGGAVYQVERESPLDKFRVDAVVKATLRDSEATFVIECKRSGFPRDVRAAIYQLHSYLSQTGDLGSDIVPVIASEALSDGAMNLLKEEGVGYFDLDGNLFLPGKSFYVLIEKPRSDKKRKITSSIFKGKRARALHAVWLAGDAWFSVGEIADRAGVSAGTASETLTSLEEREWVATRGQGPSKERMLKSRTELLDAWSDACRAIKPPATRRYYMKNGTPQSIMQMIDDVSERNGWQYEITGEAAAQLYSPYLSTVSQVRCRLNILDRIDLAEHYDLRPTSQGWNLSILYPEADGDLPFRTFREGVWFADELQTYFDLLQAGGRAKDFAAHLRQEILKA
jgi:DNA-binding transcriptional ArsR family regulator